MLVYKDYLFIGGYFRESDGNVADHLMTWDGERWADPFPDVYFTSQVKDLAIINDELYISGAFFMAGDTSWYGLAKYDGVNFCALGGPFNFVNKIVELNDTLYAITETAFAGDTLKFVYFMPVNVPADNCIYAGLGNEEVELNNSHLQAYPNPITNISNLIFMHNMAEEMNVEVINMLGEKVFVNRFFVDFGENKYVINLDKFPAGLYFIRLEGRSNAYVTKIIKK